MDGSELAQDRVP